MARLFSEEFVRAIERLRIVSRQTPRGGRHAEHRSPDLGAGMEFRDFRAYVPGDDVRRLDWNLYRRSGRLFLRLFEQPEDLPVAILLDVSDSMFFEAPPRADAARLATAILAAVALQQHDRVTIQPFGADLLPPLSVNTGRAGLRRALTYLERLGPAGPTNVVRAATRFAARRQRPGMAAVVSDFFDPAGAVGVTDALGHLRHHLALVQMIRSSDADPALDGELRLLDCESAGAVDVSITRESVERYRQAYAAFADELSRFAARRRAVHARIDADRPILDQLDELFAGGVLVT